MTFASPMLLSFIVLIVPILWLASKRRSTLGHSQVGLHKIRSVPFLGRLPQVLLILFWTALIVSFSAPQLTEYSEKPTVLTRSYQFVVDVSGSMSGKLTIKNQQDFAGSATSTSAPAYGAPAPDTSSLPKDPTRATAAEQGARLFVHSPNRKGDRVGLILFDDNAYNVWPLTLNLNTIERKLYMISKYNGGGTNFDGPSESSPNLGGIQAGINHLLQMTGPDETRVIIMITDGEDAIKPTRYAELVEEFKKYHIKLYVLGVGESWGNGTKPDLQRLCEDVGGVVIPVGDTQAMQDGFAKIDSLEKSNVQIDRIESHRDISEWFLYATILLGLLYLTAIYLVRDDA